MGLLKFFSIAPPSEKLEKARAENACAHEKLNGTLERIEPDGLEKLAKIIAGEKDDEQSSRTPS